MYRTAHGSFWTDSYLKAGIIADVTVGPLCSQYSDMIEVTLSSEWSKENLIMIINDL